MRRSISAVSIVAILVALVPAAAHAAPPTRASFQGTFIDCAMTSDDGAFVSLVAVQATGFTAVAELLLWDVGADPGSTLPVAAGLSEAVTGGMDGLSGEITVHAFDPFTDPPFGEELGTASFDAALEPFGDPIEIDERVRMGNRQERVQGTIQARSATGTLQLPGGDQADLAPCLGGTQALTLLGTNPSASITRQSALELGCFWTEGEGGFVSLGALGEAGGPALADLAVGAFEELRASGSAEAVFDRTRIEASGELLDEAGEVVGSYTVAGTIEPSGEVTRLVQPFPGGRVKVVEERLEVDGTLEVTLDGTTTVYPLDAATCFAVDSEAMEHSVRPAGPKPGPLANDTPDDAARLRLGRTTRAVTGGNDPVAEIPCTIAIEEEGEFEIPFGYTVWYTVTGTGREMTADTAGSLFDTVLAVYEEGAAGPEQIVCVDDVFGETSFSSQARVSWDSDAGARYWIQAGGYLDGAGRLRLVVR